MDQPISQSDSSGSIDKKSPKTGRQGDLREPEKRILWGRAGGRCQRCNLNLGIDPGNWRPYNLSENAHIVASATGGTRGNAETSAELADQIENHLLLCRPCHTVIDDAYTANLFPVDQLQKMKQDQESLVSRLMDLALKRQSVAIYLTAAVGSTRLQPLVIQDINGAIIGAGMVPALRRPIDIDLLILMKMDTLDDTPEFWESAKKILKKGLEEQLKQSSDTTFEQAEHISVFGMAPIPVLALLGSLLPDTRKVTPFQPAYKVLYPHKTEGTDQVDVEIRQYDRDEQSWAWPEQRTLPAPEFSVLQPTTAKTGAEKDVAIICELTFSVHEELVQEALPGSPIYKFTARDPDVNLIQSTVDVQNFARQFRTLLIAIEREYGPAVHVHVFGSLPVSCAVALGRCRVRGAPSLTVYHRLGSPARYVRGVTLSDA